MKSPDPNDLLNNYYQLSSTLKSGINTNHNNVKDNFMIDKALDVRNNYYNFNNNNNNLISPQELIN